MAKFDLKSFRENELKLKQVELAELLGVKQDAISRMENNPSQISLEMIIKIAEKTGQTVDELLKYKKPDLNPLEPEPKYDEVRDAREYLLNEIGKISKDCPGLEGSTYSSDVAAVDGCIETGMRKPVIGILGRSDSGKSTLINKLLGGNLLPTGWTPKTSINVFIKHIEERPEYIEDEVWVFKKRDKEVWDHTRLNDEKYCRKWKLAGGTVGMLDSFGTHDGDGYMKHDIGAAVLFLDAPILKNVDLLDIPGFTGAMERDTALAKAARGYIDAVVYLAQANSFLIAEDIEFLKFTFPLLGCVEAIDKDLSPLANIYVLASQAHIINKGNKEKLDELLTKGCSRFYTTITENFWKGREQAYKEYTKGQTHTYTEADLRARFFTYSIDIAELCQDFENDLKQLTEALPSAIKRRVVEEVDCQCAMTLEKINADIKANEHIIQNNEEEKERLRRQEADEYKRQSELKRNKDDVISSIQKARPASKEKFEKAYDELVQVKVLKDIIKQRGFKEKENGEALLSSYVNSRLSEEYSDIMQGEFKPIQGKIEKFLNGFNSWNIFHGREYDIDFSSDIKGKFAAGIAAGGTLGGLYLASLGTNLGGYILVVKGVSVLSAMGISIAGGTATATAAVSAIGGPVTLAIGLAVIAAFSAYKIFSSSWEEKAAKDVYNHLKKQDALGAYKKAADESWREFQDAFEKASKEAEEEARQKVQGQADKINNFDKESLLKEIKIAEKVKGFFVKLRQLVANV